MYKKNIFVGVFVVILNTLSNVREVIVLIEIPEFFILDILSYNLIDHQTQDRKLNF